MPDCIRDQNTQEPWQNYEISAQKAANDERLLAALEQLEILHEQVKSWREQAEHLQQDLQETEQELRNTNRELCNALLYQELQFEQIQQFAQKIVTTKTSVSESLAVLLSAIYHRTVQPEELESIPQSSLATESSVVDKAYQVIANSREIRKYSQQFRAQYKEFGFRFVGFNITFQRMQHLTSLFNQNREKNTAHCENIC